MKSLGCLLNDTRIAEDIKSAIQVMVADRIEKNKSATFPAIYKELMDGGIEVDAVSAGVLYNQLYAHISDPFISTTTEIDEYTEASVRQQMKELREVALENLSPAETQKIGRMPPERQNANMMAMRLKKYLESLSGETTGPTKTAMRAMQDLVGKAARSLTKSPESKKPTEITETLSNFFNTEDLKFRTLSGGVNTLRTLFNQTKKEVDLYVKNMTAEMTEEDAEIVRQKWDGYMQEFMDSAYDIMLSTGEQNKLLKEALRQVQVDGVEVVDINGNIKWGTLMQHNNPSEIADSVAKLFRDGIKDKTGNEVKYSPDQARRIGEYFQKIYEKKLAAARQQKAGLNRAKNQSSTNLISDFIKDSGNFRVVKGRDGGELMMQSDWRDALKEILRMGRDTKGIDTAVQALRDFLATKKNKEGQPFTPYQVDLVVNEFKRVVAQKMLPPTSSPSDMEKLAALNKLNGGRAFNEETQQALNNMIGISGVDQKTITKIQNLTKATVKIMNMGNVTTGTVSTNPRINRGAYAYQALAELERGIKELVRANKINRSNAQKVVKYTVDAMNTATTTLLINPNNIIENPITGFGTNIAETINMVITTPSLYRQLGELQKSFWTSFANHVAGGAGTEALNEAEIISSDLSSGERLRAKAFIDGMKTSPKTAISTILKTPMYVVSMFQRIFSNSFDAGTNAALLRKRAISTVFTQLSQNYVGYNTLTGKPNKTTKESDKYALDEMAKAFNIDPKIMDEIEQQNNEIMQVLRDAGLNPTWSTRQQNKKDMMLSLYGDVMQGAIPNASNQQKAEIAKALVESAAKQARILGGKNKIPTTGSIWDIVTSTLYAAAAGLQGVQQRAYTTMQKHEEEGRMGSAAQMQLWAGMAQNSLGRFAGGIANFGALALTATPLGFGNYKSLKDQEQSFMMDNPSAQSLSTATPDQIKKVAEFRGLQRAIAVRATMGTFAMAMFILSKVTDDDEDDDYGFIENLQETRSGRRMIQKYLPLGITLASAILNNSYDRKGKRITKIAAALEVIMNALGNQDQATSLQSQLARMSSDEDANERAIEALGNATPKVNANQIEQITRWWAVVQSAFNRDKINEVIEDEAIASELFKETEGFIEASLHNSLTDVLLRSIDENKQVNRFKDRASSY